MTFDLSLFVPNLLSVLGKSCVYSSSSFGAWEKLCLFLIFFRCLGKAEFVPHLLSVLGKSCVF